MTDACAEADFTAFAVSRWPRLLRTAYLLTGDHHDAEDLVQAVLVKAYVKWHRIGEAADPDAYAWRMLINAHRDRARRARLREWPLPFLHEEAGAAGRGADPTEGVADRDALVRALRRLPARQRAAVVLRYVEDRSETETARLLGTRVGTVRSQASRGLAKLREDGAVRSLRPVLAEGRETEVVADAARRRV
ncbi:SigE family RNA polymerase sigma factor [Streptomyces sp. NPDC127098]|uniref:SigE family RNA polymerase sigma factor n=1 Tax=Streptomyces sp. NPDC127098 TaxID=3347137 RepID=UPI00365D8788